MAFSNEATADELEASKRPKRKPPVKAAAKSVTAPPVKPSSPKPSPGQPSPNPATTKRLKGKQPNSDDPLKIIQQLQEALQYVVIFPSLFPICSKKTKVPHVYDDPFIYVVFSFLNLRFGGGQQKDGRGDDEATSPNF